MQTGNQPFLPTLIESLGLETSATAELNSDVGNSRSVPVHVPLSPVAEKRFPDALRLNNISPGESIAKPADVNTSSFIQGAEENIDIGYFETYV